ncbi:MAG: quinol dehydrogenase ferredoxin subunit NapH, partial [Gammaproteobacteria bacterium]|nr:quinol dehydrogenase ferredoxin subunit NapH [Gammaproteobacteria bacterium]
MKRVGAEATAAKGWLRAHQWLILRRISQIGILLLFLLGPWAGIWVMKGNLASALILDSVALVDPLLFLQMLAAGFVIPVTMGIAGVVIVVVFYLLVGGRVFCSWVCPVNMITDAANCVREKFLGLRIASQFPRSARYWVLGMTLVLSAVTGNLAFELVNPVSMVHRGLIFGMGWAWFVVLAVFLFDFFVAKRGWCSHLCPMGAFYSIVGSVSPIRVRADRRERCDDCMDCFEICPEPQVIKPALKGAKLNVGPVILSGNCTNCGRCIDVCAEEVFSFGTRFNNKV